MQEFSLASQELLKRLGHRLTEPEPDRGTLINLLACVWVNHRLGIQNRDVSSCPTGRCRQVIIAPQTDRDATRFPSRVIITSPRCTPRKECQLLKGQLNW